MKDFKAIAERIGGVVFTDDPTWAPAQRDALMTVPWSAFVADVEKELRREFGKDSA